MTAVAVYVVLSVLLVAGKQLVHEPMMNLWVAIAFALVMTVGWIPVFAASLVMLALWSGVAFVLARRG